jgi:hypothetical protein
VSEISSRYAGVIQTYPRIAPGYEQVWKGGNPDPMTLLAITVLPTSSIASARYT